MKSATPSAKSEEKSKVAAGAGMVSVARLLGGVINILLLVALTRLLDKTTFAVVLFVSMIQETVAVVGTLDLPTALFYFVPKLGPSASRSLGYWTSVYLALLAVPFALAVWLLGPALARALGTPEAASVFGYLAIYVLADFPAQVLPNYLLGRKSYLGFSTVTLVFYASRFASLVIPAALGVSLDGVMSCFMGVALLRLAMLVVVLAFLEKGSLARRGFSLLELLRYSVPLSLSAVVGKLSVQLDKYIIVTFCSAEVFAIYSVGATEIPLVPSLAYSVTAALMPTLVVLGEKRDVRSFLDYWHGSMLKVSAIMMPVFFFFLALADPLVRLLFSDAYGEAAVPFRVYLFLLPLRLCAYGAVVRSLGDTKPVLYSAIAGLTANAALNYPLYLLLGLAGPATASVAGQTLAIVWLLAAVRRRLAIGWMQVFPIAGVVKSFLVSGLATLPLWFLPMLVAGDGIQVGLGAVVALGLYLALALVAGVVTRADLAYLGDLITMRAARSAGAERGDVS